MASPNSASSRTESQWDDQEPRRKPRRERDDYPTPYQAVPPLLPFLRRDQIEVYVEPCAGDGKLVEHLARHDYECCLASDIDDGIDARMLRQEDLDEDVVDAVITNPPYEQPLMFEILEHLLEITSIPIWLLLEAPLMHTQQAAHWLTFYCTDIVSVGRLKLIDGTKDSSSYDFCWYRFQDAGRSNSLTQFHARNPLP